MKSRVLIVDDDSLTQKMLGSMMHKLGLECDYASDGAEAIYKISCNYYDIVLLDVLMPVVPGDQVVSVLEQLFARGLLKSPPHVVVVTGVTDKNQLSMLTRNHCVAAVLDKKLDLRRLKDLVLMFINESKYHNTVGALT